MGKYAANPECANCVAVGELCSACAMEWKEKQWSDELECLRAMANALRSTGAPARYPWLQKALGRWRAITARRPARKPAETPRPRRRAR